MTDVEGDALDRMPPVDDGEAGGEPDVLIDVSDLKVEEISLEVDDLRARVALQADVLSLLRLHVGVDAELGQVKLTIKGVEAKALLKVRLDNVARMIDRVVTTIDDNPELVEQLVKAVARGAEEAGSAVGEVARSASQALEEAGPAAGELARGATAESAAAERPAKEAPASRRRRADSTKSNSGRGQRSSRARRSQSR